MPRRRCDLLEHERSHHRISTAAFQAGLWLRSVYACEVVPGCPDKRIAWVREGRGGVGEVGEKLLHEVLGDRKTYAEIAAQRDRLTNDVTFTAKSFRNWLEAVAEMRRDPRTRPRGRFEFLGL